MLRTLALLITLAIAGAPMPTTEPARPSHAQRLAALVESCRGNPEKFMRVVMGIDNHWARQRELVRSVRDHRITVAPSGNSVGKSHVAGDIAVEFLLNNPGSIVVITAPTKNQLRDVVWKQVLRAHKHSPLPLGGRFSSDPLKLTINEEWFMLGHSGTTVEAMSGHHAKRLLFICDEASGVEEAKYEAGFSLNPDRILLLGNPLRATGRFFELCQQAGTNRFVNLVRIPSTESPTAHIERGSEGIVGLADKTWLDACLAEYGSESIWYKAHVLAQFPTESCENVVKAEWLKLCEQAIYVPSGHRRLQIDLAGGNGNDRSVILCRDDAGIRAIEHSNLWTLEETALHAARVAKEHGVEPHRVGFDKAGLGEDFGARLTALGYGLARPYLGGASAKNAVNMRSACARQLKWRLDPNRMVRTMSGVMVPQKPFAIRKEWMDLLRPELLSLRYMLTDDDGSIFALEPKAAQVATLKHSPDFCDTLMASFKHSD